MVALYECLLIQIPGTVYIYHVQSHKNKNINQLTRPIISTSSDFHTATMMIAIISDSHTSVVCVACLGLTVDSTGLGLHEIKLKKDCKHTLRKKTKPPPPLSQFPCLDSPLARGTCSLVEELYQICHPLQHSSMLLNYQYCVLWLVKLNSKTNSNLHGTRC